VINCAGRQVPNHWESIGVKYLTYFWLDQDNQLILDTKGQIANECYEFITKALDNTDSVLVHSVKAQSRAFTIMAMWIMRRYQWRLVKTLQFLNSRRPDLEIRPNFVHQLTAYESRLLAQGLGPKTSTWNEVTERTNNFENEELLLRNTYLNAQMGPIATLPAAGERRNPPRLKWADDLKERAALAVVMEENEIIPKAVENFKAVEEASNSTVKQESKYVDILKAQHLDPKGPVPKADFYADELIKKYIGTGKSNENPKLPPYTSIKEPFHDNGKHDLLNVERYDNEKQNNIIRQQHISTDIKKVQNNKQVTDFKSINPEQGMNTKEQSMKSNDAKYKRTTQYTKTPTEVQNNDSKVTKVIIEPKKYKCIEAKGSQYIDSNPIRDTDQLKTSDKFNKYIRAIDNGNQYVVKGVDPNEKIIKSINQMMDLNEAMNKKLYSETQSQKINYLQRPPSAQEQIKKVTPPKRTNTRPSSATIKRDTGIPKPTQKYFLI